ncbi:hypothetical protein ACA910_009662 [Epithemia clementina (nom. ined.)]
MMVSKNVPHQYNSSSETTVGMMVQQFQKARTSALANDRIGRKESSLCRPDYSPNNPKNKLQKDCNGHVSDQGTSTNPDSGLSTRASTKENIVSNNEQMQVADEKSPNQRFTTTTTRTRPLPTATTVCTNGGSGSGGSQDQSFRNQISVCLVIGEGSFGRVWYGRHKPTNREIALKVVDKWSCRKQPELITSLLTEQAILKSLRQEQQQQQQQQSSESNKIQHGRGNSSKVASSSPFFPVVQLLASFHDTECLYLVMECHKGGTLQDMISHVFAAGDSENCYHIHNQQQERKRRQQQYVDSIPWYAGQLLEAVCFLHARGIGHCDLKPANVLVSSLSGRLLLTDFGSAVEFPLSSSSSSTSSYGGKTTRLSHHRNIQGTTMYSAPEMLGITRRGIHSSDESQNATPAMDLWSLGCIIYALWCGQSPFAAPSDFLVTESIQSFCSKTTSDQKRHLWLTQQHASLLLEVVREDDRCEPWISAVWLDLLVQHLLQLDPVARMGLSSTVTVVCAAAGAAAARGDMLYPVLRRHPAWSQQVGILDHGSTPSFLPPEPDWVQQLQDKKDLTWRDGSLGWSAFLV